MKSELFDTASIISFSMSHEIEEYIKELEAKASEGDMESMDLHTLSLHHGQFMEIDLQRSFELFSKTAAMGSAVGSYSIGVMYEHGMHVTKDIDKAISYFMIAAEKGHQAAFNNLAWLHFDGPESFRDTAKGNFMMKMAATLETVLELITMQIFFNMESME